MQALCDLHRILKQNADAKTAAILQRFFKTRPGEYGAGDKFLGIRVPDLRRIAKEFQDLEIFALEKLIKSKWHEERLIALLIAVLQYEKAQRAKLKAICAEIYAFYLQHMSWINNWDLVDLSAPNIVGSFLFDKDRAILNDWARAKFLWQRRIAIISTHYFIRHNQFATTLAIAKNLLNDKEDLIHKACGWMLREIGKRDLAAEEGFLQRYYKKMPRTMLRYAIEKFPQEKRQDYLKGRV